MYIKKSHLALAMVIGLGLIFSGFSFLSNTNDTKTTLNQDTSKTYQIKPVVLPKQADFCGEQMPLENFDTYESLDREILVNTYWQSQTLIFIKKANRYFPIIEPILKEHGVPDDFKYLAVAESGLTNVVSPSGAKGFWQFLKGTAGDYKLEVNEQVDERYHIEKATHAAAKFLKESHAKYDSWTLAAASYNMGRRNVSKHTARQKSNNYYDLVLGDETGRYVFRIVALKLIIENPEQYGFYVSDTEKYEPVKYHEVKVDSAITDLAYFAHLQGVNYKTLKELNPWLRDNLLTNKYKKSYIIKIAKPEQRKILPNPDYFPEH